MITKKLTYIAATFMLGFLTIIIRLFQLQIILENNFFSLGQQNFTRIERIAPLRGNILDCNGQHLATNRPVASLYWQGHGPIKLTQEQQETLKTIETIMGSPFSTEIYKNITNAQRSCTATCLIYDITLKQLGQILEIFPSHPNLCVKNHFKRFYPYKTMACHILGHINHAQLDITGKMGLEKIAHPALHGKQGKIIKTINSKGTNLYQHELQSALAGEDIITTIDIQLQALAEHLFPREYAGAIIIMDPKTGALRATLSAPYFDPSLFLEPIEADHWNNLQSKKPFINRAFSACYPPASTFKLVTISAALELGIVHEDDTITCKGFYSYKGRPYFCNQKYGHGKLDLITSMAKSCNIVFFDIGSKIHIDQLASYAKKFGLGQKTGIIFPESEGLIPTSAWKREHRGEPWWQGETLSNTIGQSYTQATPLQIACLIGSIFEEYRVRPRILESEPIDYFPLDIKDSTRSFLQKSMRAVVEGGTGANIGNISEDIEIHAKTGTAQTASLTTAKSGNPQHLEHAWFVAYFRYKNNDPLVMVIMLEHAGKAKFATAVAKKILMNYHAMMKQKEIGKIEF